MARRSSEPSRLVVQTAGGPAHAHVYAVARPRATLVLGHGAGRASDTADLLDLAAALPAHRIQVIRFDQPWVIAGRKIAPAPKNLDAAWLEAVPQLPLTGALLLGGRSAGARVACRTATSLGAAGVLALAFPLHPPGRPEKSRVDELTGAGVPVLVLQGGRDAFGRPAEFPSQEGLEVVPVEGADHSLRAGIPQPLTELVTRWGIARV